MTTTQPQQHSGSNSQLSDHERLRAFSEDLLSRAHSLSHFGGAVCTSPSSPETFIEDLSPPALDQFDQTTLGTRAHTRAHTMDDTVAHNGRWHGHGGRRDDDDACTTKDDMVVVSVSTPASTTDTPAYGGRYGLVGI